MVGHVGWNEMRYVSHSFGLKLSSRCLGVLFIYGFTYIAWALSISCIARTLASIFQLRSKQIGHFASEDSFISMRTHSQDSLPISCGLVDELKCRSEDIYREFINDLP